MSAPAARVGSTSACKKEMECSDSRAEVFWEVIGEARDHALILLDPHGTIVSWHQGAREILAYEPSEIIGAPFSRLYPAEAVARAWPELELEVAAAQGRFSGEGWRVRQDGSRFWASVELVALRDSAGALCGFGKLVRERGQRKGSQLLGSAHRMLDWLSNEVRNSLAPICGVVHLMQRRWPGEPEVARTLEILDGQCSQLVQLVGTLSDLSQAPGGRLRLERRELELAALLPRALQSCRPVMRAHEQMLGIEVPSEPVRLWGDPVRLGQVLRTLVLGAVRHCAVGVPICVRARCVEGELEIRVGEPRGEMSEELKPEVAVDSGVGFTEEEGPGERFVGLTLALAREVLKLHGGSLGDGLSGEFVIRLPLSRAPAAAGRPQSGAVEAGFGRRGQDVSAKLDRHFVRAVHLDALHQLLSTTVFSLCPDAVFGSAALCCISEERWRRQTIAKRANSVDRGESVAACGKVNRNR